MSRAPLARVTELEADRVRLHRELDRLERRRHAAIVAAIDDGASVTAVATALGVTRQALSKYLTRRENHDTSA